MSVPAKWTERAGEVFTRIGQLSMQRRVLAAQLAETERRLEEAQRAAESLEATAALAAELAPQEAPAS